MLKNTNKSRASLLMCDFCRLFLHFCLFLFSFFSVGKNQQISDKPESRPWHTLLDFAVLYFALQIETSFCEVLKTRKPELRVSRSVCLLWLCLLAPVLLSLCPPRGRRQLFPPLKECFQPQCQWRWNLG